MVGQTLVRSLWAAAVVLFGRVVRSCCPITPTSFYSSLDASVAPLVAMASLNAVTLPRVISQEISGSRRRSCLFDVVDESLMALNVTPKCVMLLVFCMFP